jgi:hypothetical protein
VRGWAVWAVGGEGGARERAGRVRIGPAEGGRVFFLFLFLFSISFLFIFYFCFFLFLFSFETIIF